MSFAERLVATWYTPGLTLLAAALLPLSLLFRLAMTLRRWAYRARLLHTAALPVRVIVVGSIVVGGTVDVFDAGKLDEAEVGDAELAVLAHEHVAGLDVAVHDAGPVRGGEGLGDVGRHRGRRDRLHRPAPPT